MIVRIVIVQVEHEECSSATEWRKVAESGNVRDGGAVYDYVQPPDKTTREKTVQIYQQEVEIESIRPIIAAINGLEVHGK